MSETLEKSTNDVVVIERLNPVTVFAPGGVEDVLSRLEREVREMARDADISTPPGRERIASLAYKVARSKTALDGMGKDLTEDWRKRTSLVNVDRKIITTRLDALKDEVRKPLTDWENAEKIRVQTHERLLAEIPEGPTYGRTETAAELQMRLDSLLNYPDRDWQEFSARFKVVMTGEIDRTAGLLAAAQKREAEAAELAILRAQEAERQRIQAEEDRRHREAELARKAAEAARVAAEQAAAAQAARVAAETAERERAAAAEAARREREAAEAIAEAERRAAEDLRAAEARAAQEAADAAARQAEAERREREAQERAERAERERRDAEAAAERRRIEAAEQAERDQVAAIAAERLRAARLDAAERAEAERRATNKAHRTMINRAAASAIMAAGPAAEDVAQAIVVAIARGEIPHIALEY